jgi:ABC-type dipeptide/oligopeptide/nickel transport system ATPase subunit
MLLQKRILEWSKGLPNWQRDLLRRVAEGALSDQDRGAVLAMLLNESKAPAPVPLELEHLPADDGEFGRVELTGISNLSNINLLASGQELPLAPGLNIVFGLTGAGKSGYGRLLCRLCRAAHQDEVLRDVFDPGVADAPQTAHIDITVDGTPTGLDVDLADTPPRALSSIAVFNSQCAGVYLSGPRTIDHVPRAMRILKELVDAQGVLATDLENRIRALREGLPELPSLGGETEASRRVAAIDAETDLSPLEQWTTLSDAEFIEFEELETAEATVKADQGRAVEAAARSNANAAERGREMLQQAADRLTDTKLENLRSLRIGLDEAIAVESELADRAFAGQRFSGTGQGPWREMWEAARRFVESSGGTFPNTGPDAACPTCQQDLDPAAKARMATFETFVREDLGRQTATARSRLSHAVEAIPDVSARRVTIDAALDRTDDALQSTVAQAIEVLRAREQIARAIASGIEEPVRPAPLVSLGPIADYAKVQVAVAEQQVAMRDENEQRRRRARLADLRDRQTLAASMSAVRMRVSLLRKIAQLESAKDKLNSRTISGQLRELQRAAITDRLRDAVARELEGLDPVSGRIEVVGQASKGETVIQLRLKDAARAKVGTVLSEGEQRALGLAFFLADVAVSQDPSAIVLDDPISSLDHDRRRYVAQRLVEEAQRRQVVVLTHDFTFVHLLQETAEEVGINVAGRTLERAYHQIGVVSDDLPSKIKSPAKLGNALRDRLKGKLGPLHRRQDPDYEHEADSWTTDLRKAYEHMIEANLFGGTIRRWQHQVRLPGLRKVTWSMDVVHRIEKAMKKLSGKAHFEASELQPAAFTLDELAGMLQEYEELCALTHYETQTKAKTASGDETEGLRAAS